MDAHSESILQEFKENEKTFKKLKEVVVNLITQAIAKKGMYVTGIEARVKTEKSLAGKLELKGMKYRSLSDITDILGARVITFYSDEVDSVAALMENMFVVDWDNSVDKRKIYDSDRFGYMSLHYICSVPKELYYDENMPMLNEIRFEIQIRTALQHVWATINHDMGYKSDVEIPKEYARKISRLAGLLELADEEFKTFKTDIAEYRRKILALVKDRKFEDITLNGDSFKDYLTIDPFKKLNDNIASSLGAEIQEVSLLPYLDVLAKIGIKTLGDIEKMKKDYSEDVKRLVLYQMEGKDIDIISSTVGIHNLCIVYVLKQDGGSLGVKLIYDLLYGERDRNVNSAKRTIEQAKALNII